MLARFIMLIAALLLTFGGVALADTEGHAVAHVYVQVDPNISCGAITPNVDLNTIQTGPFSGQIIYRIDANVERVAISVSTSMLYKGDDPTDPFATPIPVLLEDGALVEPTDANPIQGGSPILAYTGPWDYEGFLGNMTEFRQYESSQRGFFSQDVYVTVSWIQADPELTQGEYSGFVAMWSHVVL